MSSRGVCKYLAGMGMGVQVRGTSRDSWRKSRLPGEGYYGGGQKRCMDRWEGGICLAGKLPAHGCCGHGVQGQGGEAGGKGTAAHPPWPPATLAAPSAPTLGCSWHNLWEGGGRGWGQGSQATLEAPQSREAGWSKRTDT